MTNAEQRRLTNWSLGAVLLQSQDVQNVTPSCAASASTPYDDPMADRQLLRVRVECNAGHRGEQTQAR